MRGFLGAVMVACALGACGSDGGPEPGAQSISTFAPAETTEATTTTRPTTTQSTTTTLFIYADEPPELINTGDDWIAILNSLIGYQEWAEVQQSEEAFSRIACPGSEAQANLLAGLRRIKELGVTELDTPGIAAATEVRLHNDNRPVAVQLYAVTLRNGFVLRDATGQAVLEQPPRPPEAEIVELRTDPQGAWCLEKSTSLGEAP